MLVLPEIISFHAYEGNWERYLQAIYNHFCKDFIHSKPLVPNRRVGLKKMPIEKGKEATFWHFVSTGETENDREICFRRCERITWIRPIIENYHASNVRWWVEFKSVKSGNKRRICITLHDFSYLVVLDDREEFILPWTAYPIEKEHQRQKLDRRWKEASISSRTGEILF
jgi:hypothetical protein